MKTNHFYPKLESLMSLVINKLKYPDWFDISNFNNKTDNEEKYLELRSDLLSFLEPLLKINHF